MAIVDEDESITLLRVNPTKGIRYPESRLKNLSFKSSKYESAYPDPTPFNPFEYIKNPLVLLVGGSLFVAYGLPYLMGGIDMEALREEQGMTTATPAFDSSFVKTIQKK